MTAARDSGLKQRVMTAAVLAPLVVIAVVWFPRPAMAVLSALAFVLAFDEWRLLCGFRGLASRIVAAVVLASLCALMYFLATPQLTWLVMFAGCLWWLLATLWLGRNRFAAAATLGNRLLKLAAGLLAIVPAWTALMWLHGHWGHGIWLLIALLLVWAADIGAYFAGTRFGRRKLAPSISPGKTWAGVWGAMALSLLVAGLIGGLLQLPALAWIALLLLTAVAVAASIVGDLVESLLKRQATVKDSGTLMPGHGGLLDRIDSLFALLPVFVVGLMILGL